MVSRFDGKTWTEFANVQIQKDGSVILQGVPLPFLTLQELRYTISEKHFGFKPMGPKMHFWNLSSWKVTNANLDNIGLINIYLICNYLIGMLMNFKSTRSGNQEVDMAFKTFYASILNIKAKTTMKKKMKNLTWTFVANMVHILKSWTVIRMKNRTLLSNWMRSMRKQEAWKKKKKLKKNFKKKSNKKRHVSLLLNT